ncbi:hypothetical protein DFH09DRAFT_1357603 [Mycena vulgaris]|nr:hypothetical protein DFH09DRAFT_1357603 [Mycena vulgaris]
MDDLFQKTAEASRPLRARQHLPRSNPQLPHHLLEQFRRDSPNSIIFTLYFGDVRHFMLIGGPTPELECVIPIHFNDIVQTFNYDSDHAERDLSYLHLALFHGELPLAHESLRLGTSVHRKDPRTGYSPLFYGFENLFGYMEHGKIIVGGPLQVIAQANLEAYVARISQRRIPPRPRLPHWILGPIRALLLHGATPGYVAISQFINQADSERFECLVHETSTAIRPARICPCGSARPLADCHALSRPYPAQYICPCGSRNINAACCAKTDISWTEKWNEEKEWLDFGRTAPLDPSLNAMYMKGVVAAELEPLIREFSWFDKPNLPILKGLVESCHVDPAYAAACKETMLALSPAAARAIPQTEWVKAMTTWNEAVDKYIASGVDDRSPEIIEAAGKTGLAGGPFYRRCEAAGCAGIESISTTFPQCSGCKTAVYCSPSCQKSAWKAHKSACYAGTVQAQMLPSQAAYAAKLARVTGSSETQGQRNLRARSAFTPEIAELGRFLVKTLDP